MIAVTCFRSLAFPRATIKALLSQKNATIVCLPQCALAG